MEWNSFDKDEKKKKKKKRERERRGYFFGAARDRLSTTSPPRPDARAARWVEWAREGKRDRTSSSARSDK